jgi:hypothetical protein
VATSNKYYPKCSARQIPASFPLGSIIPYISSFTESVSLANNSDVVPPRNGVVLLVKMLTKV